MADELQGGLNAVNQTVEVPNEETPAVQESSKEALFKLGSEDKLRKQRAVYDAHLQQMIDSFKGRTENLGYDPKLLAMSRGFLTPGKTGNFFESLGTAFGGYGEAAQEEQKLKLDDMLTKEKLLGLQISQTEKERLLEQDIEGKKYLNEMAAKRYKQSPNQLDVTNVSGKPTARQILSGSSGSRGLITLEDIDRAPLSVKKQLQEDYKRQQEDIKIAQEGAKGVEVELPFIGVRKVSNKFAQEIDMIVNSPQYQALPREERKALMQQHYSDFLEGIEPPTQGDEKTISQATEKPALETTSQREQRLKLEGKAGENIIEADKEDRKTIKANRDSARTIIQSADILYDLASNPKTKETFGVLQRAGVINSLLGLAEEGIGGEMLSIRIKGLEDAIRKNKYTDSQGKPINPNDLINGARLAQQQIAQLSLSFGKTYLQGQGAVSDFERKLVEDTIPNIKDPAMVIMMKAEIMKARAVFDRDMGRAAMDWVNKDPLHRTIEQYKATDDYQRFVDKLDSSAKGIMQTYFPNANVTTQSKPSSTPTGNYADIIKQEKERRKLQ